MSFSHCTGPGVLAVTVAASCLPWPLTAMSYSSSAGVMTATISGIHATLAGPGCSATIYGSSATASNGTVKLTYTNGTHKLVVIPSPTPHANLRITTSAAASA